MGSNDKWELVSEGYFSNGVPVVKTGIRHTRLLTRGHGYLDDVTNAANLDQAAMLSAIESDERLDDLVRASGTLAVESSDERYRRIIGRLVGSAFSDAATIEVQEVLVRWVSDLGPVAIRTLVGVAQASGVWPVPRVGADRVRATPSEIARYVQGLTLDMVQVLIRELESKHLLTSDMPPDPPPGAERPRHQEFVSILTPVGWDILAADLP